MNFKNPIILGSKSPRRRALLKYITSDFEVASLEVNEEYPELLPSYEVAEYLARKKALAYKELFKNNVIITSDTTVILDNAILGKPDSFDQGFTMLKSLAGRSHQVNTAVHICFESKSQSISEFTKVYFPKLDDSTITDYLKRFNPFDKAGAYGIQECVNDATAFYSPEELSFLIHQKKIDRSKEEFAKVKPSFLIESIEGSFFNVVGFPIVEFAKVLKEFV
ncbi:MAG: Maf family protein [Bacteroidota bacterium]